MCLGLDRRVEYIEYYKTFENKVKYCTIYDNIVQYLKIL